MIKIPPLTTDRRKELVKFCEQLGEKQKIATRNIRQDAMKEGKKQFDEKIISEDQKKNWEIEIDALTKSAIEKIEHSVVAKSQDIMKV